MCGNVLHHYTILRRHITCYETHMYGIILLWYTVHTMCARYITCTIQYHIVPIFCLMPICSQICNH